MDLDVERAERALPEHMLGEIAEAARTAARLMKVPSRAPVEEELAALEVLVRDLRKHYQRSVLASGGAAKWVAAAFGRAIQTACGWEWVLHEGIVGIASRDRRFILYVGLVAHDLVAVRKRPIALRSLFDTIRNESLPAAEPRSYRDIHPVPSDSPVHRHPTASRF